IGLFLIVLGLACRLLAAGRLATFPGCWFLSASGNTGQACDRENERKEEQTLRDLIRLARNIPSWHKPVAEATLSVAAALLLSYAVCRRAQLLRDESPVHTGCVTRHRSWSRRQPGRADCKW